MPYRTALRSLVLKFEFQQQSPAVQIIEVLLGTLTADYPELKRTPSSFSAAEKARRIPGIERGKTRLQLLALEF